jgi:hypothetical protein
MSDPSVGDEPTGASEMARSSLVTTTRPASHLNTPAPPRRTAVGQPRPDRFVSRAVLAALLFWASRLGMLLVAGALAYVKHTSLLHDLTAWDGGWYLLVARDGYPSVVPASGSHVGNDLGFFPLLPLLVRLLVAASGLSYSVAGLVVGFIAGTAATVVVWFLLRDLAGDAPATRGVALLVTWPGAFVLSMVYGEGLLIALSAGALLALQRRRWVTAGVCAGFATATDPVAGAVVVACAVAAAVAIRRRGEWRSLAAVVLSPAGLVGFFSYLWVHTGDPLAWFDDQRAGWQGGTYGGSIPHEIAGIAHTGLMYPNNTFRVATLVVALALLVPFFRARPTAGIVAYVLTALCLGAFSPVIGITPRLVLRAFPLVAVAGTRFRGALFEVTLVVFALAMAGIAIVSMGGHGFTP